MKFRIKYVPKVGYFSQVKTGFFSPWKRIGKHVCGFGLYSQYSFAQPMLTSEEAEARCHKYKEWTALISTYLLRDIDL